MREFRNKVLESLAADASSNNLDSILKTEDLQNNIEESDLAIQEPLQIIVTRDEGPNTTPNVGAIQTGREIYKNIDESTYQSSEASARNI